MSKSIRYRASLNAIIHDVRIALKARSGNRTSAPGSATLLIHIPKCAGISLRHALSVPNQGHKLLCDFSPEALERATAITFCTRDPFDRMVSAFRYLQRLKQLRPFGYAAVGHPKVGNFTEFVHSQMLEQLEAYHFFFRSQYQYLKGIEAYRDKAVHLRFEHLGEDFKHHFGGDLPRLNATARATDDAIDTPENRDRVRMIYRADYEILPNLLIT